MITSYLEKDYSKIYLIYPSPPPLGVTEVQVYYNNEYLASFVKAPSDPTHFAKPLDFIYTLTSVGNRWMFAIEPADLTLDLPILTKFVDGVYHFVPLFGSNIPDDMTGEVVDEDAICCMAKALQDALGAGDAGHCDSVTDEKIADLSTVHAYLKGADIALRANNPELAACAWDVVDTFCNGCGCSE
jgi:hypothetical protein